MSAHACRAGGVRHAAHRVVVALTLILTAGPIQPARAQQPLGLAVACVNDHGRLLIEATPGDGARLRELLDVGHVLNCRPDPRSTLLVVSPEQADQLTALGIAYRVLHTDVQQLIDEEAALRQAARRQRGTFFSDYATLAEMDAYLDTLVAVNPQLASRSTIGTSVEGRPIWVLHIASPNLPADAPQFVISGCQHAREWISPMTAFYIADQLIRGYGGDPRITGILDRVEFYIVPVTNPDGYNYSQTTDRFWRKNRRNNGNGTFGVDLNRNWSVGFGGPTSSSDPSSDVYRGPFAFSEPETQALRDLMLSLPRLRGHIDLHSYSQLILGPWAYTDTPPPRLDELIPASIAICNGIMSIHEQPYPWGFGGELIYLAGGVAPDWSFGTLGSLSWTIELRDRGTFGFVLPPDQIIPTGQETLAGILALAEKLPDPIEYLFPQDVPVQLDPNQPTSFPVDVRLWHGASLAAAPELLVRVGGGSFTPQPLSGSGPWTATLPAAPCGTPVEFYLRASTTDGTIVTSPRDAPQSVYVASAGTLSVTFSDDFQTDQGWSVSGNVLTGAWERGVPAGDGSRGDPTSDYDGSGACWLTENAAGNTDVDDGRTVLTSPPLDLSTGGTIHYAWWLDDAGFGLGRDALVVEVATDAAGSDWRQVRRYDTPQHAWRTDTIVVGNDVPASSTLRIRFIASDLEPGNVVEAAIDAVTISAFAPCGCVGDLDGNGTIDLTDLSTLLSHFGTSGASPADGDLDGDGDVDLTDLSAMLSMFGTDCP